ncbi:AraC family transcriptional regulator [Flavobacterium magnum]|uniref:AraC family transcriptional regulator n=1 Tax=Flavobacterium magnum TaxID=2162713 RepID=A0A2S0RFJ1_9FLAO|nr:AraC family transcriptional regulator [Flavobacterium magnum]AWA30060.1 AraC family transcriptional regulator [Flavobacterium magnum]
MLFEFSFYSSLLLVIFSQGIIFALLLLRKGIAADNPSNVWLSAFIFCCSLYFAPWMLGFAGWYDAQPYRDILFYIPFQQLFLVGPLIYCYTQSLLNPQFSVTKNVRLHFVLPAVYLVYCLLMWIYDDFIYEGYYFYASGSDKDFEPWYQYAGLASMGFYLIRSIRFYDTYNEIVVQVTSFADGILFRWIKTYLVAFLILMSLPVIFDLVALFYPQATSYAGSWWYFLAYSVVMYYLALTAYSNPVVQKMAFRVYSEGNQQRVALGTPDDAPPTLELRDQEETKKLPDLEHWKQRIERLIRDESLYRNPELTLLDVSTQLGKNPTFVSKAVNQGFGMSFNDLVNSFRIDAVCTGIANNEHQQQTLLGIALDSGFNSKATFNRAFKKHTGQTPTAFLALIPKKSD